MMNTISKEIQRLELIRDNKKEQIKAHELELEEIEFEILALKRQDEFWRKSRGEVIAKRTFVALAEIARAGYYPKIVDCTFEKVVYENGEIETRCIKINSARDKTSCNPYPLNEIQPAQK